MGPRRAKFIRERDHEAELAPAVRGSAGTSRPAVDGRPPWGVKTPAGGLRSTLLLPCPRPVLAQPDLEEYQQHGPAKPEGHQGDGEHLAGQAADQDGAHHPYNDQPCG